MKSRYPGTQPFTDSPEDVQRFFGRQAEAEDLYLRVLSVPLLVQFGSSGLGKTSLLQAGLFPRLRQKPFLPVMIRLNDAEESLTAAVVRAVQESCAAEGIEPSWRSTDGLWELLSSLTVWRDDLLLTPVLVFDQFEEVFTLRDTPLRAEIASELGALASGIPPARAAGTRRPTVKVLISLREDYLGALEEFSAAIPGLFEERLRLGPMTEEAAREAITGPARLVAPDLPPPFDFDPAALDLLMSELQGKSGVIEPFQLQLLARHAETVAMRKGAAPVLTCADFTGNQSFSRVRRHFYRDTLHRVTPRLERRRARRLVEEGLLSATGHRLPGEEGEIRRRYRVTAQTLQTLESSRLIRRDIRLDSVFYEISHDQLANAIFRERGMKLPQWVPYAIVVLAVVAAVLGWTSFRVRQEKQVSDELIAFLLGEQFLGELRDVGRISLLEALQMQIGTTKQPPMTQALALRNEGDIARGHGRLAHAAGSFAAAVAILNQEETGDGSVARELARTEERLVGAQVDRGNVSAAVKHADAAITAWRRVTPLSTPTFASPNDCYSLAGALVSAADVRARIGQSDRAMQNLEEAADIVFDSLFGDSKNRCAPPPRPQPYPDGTALRLLSSVAFSLATLVDSEENYAGAAGFADRARWLRVSSTEDRRQALASNLMRAATAVKVEPAEIVREHRSSVRELAELSRWDTDNLLLQRDVAVAQMYLSTALVACRSAGVRCPADATVGDPESLTLKALADLRIIAAKDRDNVSWQDDLVAGLQTRAHVLTALNQPAEALRQFDEAERIRRGIRRDRADTQPLIDEAFMRVERAHTEAAAGHRQAAARQLQIATDRIEQLSREQPRNFVAFHFLNYVWSRRAALGDKTDAQQATRRMAMTAPVLASRDQRLDGLVDAHKHHLERAAQLEERTAILRELTVAAETLREYISVRPAEPLGFDALRDIYERMAGVHDALGQNVERGAALQKALLAAHIHKTLSPDPSAVTAAGETAYAYAGYLFAQDRQEESTTILQEAITLAEELTPARETDANSWWTLARSECGLGRMRYEAGLAGWKEPLSAGVMHLRIAAAKDPAYNERLQYWTNYLATASAEAAGTPSRPSASTRP